MRKTLWAIIIPAVLGLTVFYLAYGQALPASPSKSRCELIYPGADDPGPVTAARISLRVINPNGPSINAKIIFGIPTEITPIGLAPYKIWDAEERILLLFLGNFAANEQKQFLLDFEGVPVACLIYGLMEGEWSPPPAIGPATWQDEVNFSLTITEAPAPAQKVPPAAPLAAGALGAFAVAAGVPWWELLQLLNLASLAGLRRREEKPWGVVIDKASRRPVTGASVKVFDAASRKLKDSQLTDVEGRFGFLVPPGLYYLHIGKGGYQEYESEFIEVPESEEEALNLEIKLEEKSRRGVFWRTLGGWLRETFAVGSPWILVLGTIVSLVIAILFPSTLHYIVLGLYVALDILKIIIDNWTVKPFGTVTSRADQLPLALAVVKVFDARRNWLMQTRVTNQKGQFKLLILPGEYIVTCSKQDYQSYASESLTVRRADVIKLDIPMTPEEGGELPTV